MNMPISGDFCLCVMIKDLGIPTGVLCDRDFGPGLLTAQHV